MMESDTEEQYPTARVPNKDVRTRRRLFGEFFKAHSISKSVRNKVQSSKPCGDLLHVTGKTKPLTFIVYDVVEVKPQDEEKLFAQNWETPAGPVRDQRSHSNCSTYVSTDLFSSVRLLTEKDDVFRTFSAKYLTFHLCEKMRAWEKTNGKRKKTHHCHGFSIARTLKFLQYHGVPEEDPEDELIGFSCVIEESTEDSPVLFKLDEEVAIRVTNKLEDLYEALLYQPVGANLHFFDPEFTDIGEEIYEGPKADGTYYDLHAVIIKRILRVGGKLVAEVKSSHGTETGNQGYMYVSLTRKFIAIGEGNDIGSVSLLLTQFTIPDIRNLKKENLEPKIMKRKTDSTTDQDSSLVDPSPEASKKFERQLMDPRLLDRFTEQVEENHGIKQTESVAEYINEFEDFSSVMLGVSENNLVDIFFNGLKPEMQEVIKLKGPQGLTQHKAAVVKIESTRFCKVLSAQSVEEKSSRRWGNQIAQNGSVSGTGQRGWVQNQKPQGYTKEFKQGDETKGTYFQCLKNKLTAEEIIQKRRDGLCFKCDDKWSCTHDCPDIELKILTVLDGKEVKVIEEYDEEEMVHGEQHVQLMELSLNAFLGIDTPTTTKMRGKMGTTDVIIMLDSGATQNFIAPLIVDTTHLKLHKNNNLQILLGTGVVVQGLGLCTQVCFTIQELSFCADLVSLELGGADIILGVNWQRTLGKCEMDWNTHEITFNYEGSRATLKGEADLHAHRNLLQAVSTPRIDHSFQDPAGIFNALTQDTEEHTVPSEIVELLQRLTRVFETPKGLPPLRGHKHAIHLLPGVTAVFVRPYRYPQTSKSVMEQMVNEMLQTGVIRVSRSPLSSHVLLDKKKDNSWRFCG